MRWTSAIKILAAVFFVDCVARRAGAFVMNGEGHGECARVKRRSTANDVEIKVPVPPDADTPKFKVQCSAVLHSSLSVALRVAGQLRPAPQQCVGLHLISFVDGCSVHCALLFNPA